MLASEWQISACKPHIECFAPYTENTTGVMDSILIIAAQGILYTENTISVLDSNHD